MFSGHPVTPAEPRRDESVPAAAHCAVLVAHQPRPLPAVPASRHRREGSPGCLKGLLTAATAVARWVLARVRQKVAHLCRRLPAVCTSCATAGAFA